MIGRDYGLIKQDNSNKKILKLKEIKESNENHSFSFKKKKQTQMQSVTVLKGFIKQIKLLIVTM